VDSLNDICSVNAGYWATKKHIKLQAGEFSFLDHEYQLEPMCSKVRRRCYRKATQGGWTEIEVLRTLWALIHRHHPSGDLYMFPTDDTVQDFAKSRFNPLMLANHDSIGKYVKPGGKGTDTATLKKVHGSFLYLRSARLSQKLHDVKESAQMISIPVDSIKFDELDKIMEVIAKARGRYGHSHVKEEVFLSNPLVPGEGIDKMFELSDQRYWYRKCNSCGKWTCAELFFMEDIEGGSPERCVGTRADGTGYIACKNCGREVFIRDGEWQPETKANSDFMHGYHWSQLTSTFNDPLEILHNFRNPPEGNLADVYRLRLGLPYIAEEDRLVMSQVFECWHVQ